LILKILTRYVVVLVGLLAVPAVVMGFYAFVRGAHPLRNHDFILAVEVYIFFVPFVTALFVVPSTIREYRDKKRKP